jgi:uncharacterized cupredoxin-like copper-binding protein
MLEARRRFLTASAVGIGMILVLTACGPQNITADVTSFEFTLSQTEARPGDIIFTVNNVTEDELIHEFVVVQTDLAHDALPVDVNGDVDEAQLTVVDEIEDIEPGTTHELKVTLAAGHYVILCNVEGHYKQGMHADFTVK